MPRRALVGHCAFIVGHGSIVYLCDIDRMTEPITVIPRYFHEHGGRIPYAFTGKDGLLAQKRDVLVYSRRSYSWVWGEYNGG